MSDERQFLRRYVEESSEEAFCQFVAYHLNFVYSVALRFVHGDSHLAQDVVQTVFADVARKADRLCDHRTMEGWLYRHTFFISATMIRAEKRRKNRERSSMEAEHLTEPPPPAWLSAAPSLDEALTTLSHADRNAVLLRFFQKKDLRFVGETLGISEDAAQKRITRALEKLRMALSQKGALLTPPALAAALGGFSISSAPLGLAGSVAAASISLASAAPGVTVLGAKLLSLTKLKTGFAAAVLMSAVTFPVAVLQHQQIVRLEDERRLWEAQSNSLAQAGAGAPVSPLSPSAASPLWDEHLELMRLRSEVGRLRRENLERRQSTPATLANSSASSPTNVLGKLREFTPSAEWSDAGVASPEAAAETLLWTLRTGNAARFHQMVQWQVMGPDVNVNNVGFRPEIVEPLVVQALTTFITQLQGGRILSIESLSPDGVVVQFELTRQNAQVLSKTAIFARQDAAWKVALSLIKEGPGQESLHLPFAIKPDLDSEQL